MKTSVVQIFEYLLAVKNLTVPVIRDIQGYNDQYWWQAEFPVGEGCYLQGTGSNPEAWLEVRKQVIPPPPPPPPLLKEWLINEGTEQGTIEEAEQEIIERVFHLGDRNITSLMTHRSDIIWFDLDENEETIKEKIIREPHSVYPICDGEIDNIKGVVSIKDLYVTDDSVLFKDIMTPALFVPENNTAYMVLEKFKQSKIHCCFIVDEYGSLLAKW